MKRRPKLLKLPETLDPISPREYHDITLARAANQLYSRTRKYHLRKHHLAKLISKEFFETYANRFLSLLETELERTQISGYYTIFNNFRISTINYLQQHLNPIFVDEFFKNFEVLVRHLVHYQT